MGDSNKAILEALDEHIRSVAQEVFAESYSAVNFLSDIGELDSEAKPKRARLQSIQAKEFISVAESALLLNCSDGHIRNLVGRAKKGRAKCPIPYRDLDGVTVFQREELLAWTQMPKTVPQIVRQR